MHFHICLANHSPVGRETIHDSLVWLQAGLEENGHNVTVSDTDADRGAMNVFWECFVPHFAEQLVASNIDYGIVATEIPTGASFNERRVDPEWISRWLSFETAATRAKFIWCTTEQPIETYSHYAPTAYLELGFTERLIPSEPRRRPTYDFSFSGVSLDYRVRILEALGRRTSVVYSGGILRRAEQSALIRSGRVSLALKQAPYWPWPSQSRIGLLVHESIPIAAQWTEVHNGVSRLVPRPAEFEDFVEFAVNRLSLDLEKEAADILERYREMPMRGCVARMLDLSLGNSRRQVIHRSLA